MVDVLLMPGKYKKKIILPNHLIDKIPNKIILFSTVQFLHQLPDIARQLEVHNKKVLLYKSKNYLYDGLISEKGQLLGCNMENFVAKTVHEGSNADKNSGADFDAFLYIGDGMFHPKALLINNDRDVYCYDPKTNKLGILDKKIHKEYSSRRKGGMIKFLSSGNIGILITTKIGQSNPKRAQKLKYDIKARWPDKKVYVFYSDEISFSELENFNFIDIYINAACSRIGHDDTKRAEKSIINIADVEDLLKDSTV